MAVINGTNPAGEDLTGTNNSDTITGLGGNDTISGLGENDALIGGDCPPIPADFTKT